MAGGGAQRRKGRELIGAWSDDRLHTGPSEAERTRIRRDLARQGWSVVEGRLVIGEPADAVLAVAKAANAMLQEKLNRHYVSDVALVREAFSSDPQAEGTRRLRPRRLIAAIEGNHSQLAWDWVGFPPMKASAATNLRHVLGVTFTYGEAKQAHVSDRRLYRMRDSGEVIALGGGVYRWADAPAVDTDLVEIAERVPRATLCLGSALARHGLIDAIPAAIDIAIPRGSRRPTLRAPCRLHQFDPKTFELGRETIDVGARRPLGLYSPERSLVDVVRLRHLEGSDMAWEALRRWLRRPGRSPAQLIELARSFLGAEPALRRALEILL